LQIAIQRKNCDDLSAAADHLSHTLQRGPPSGFPRFLLPPTPNAEFEEWFRYLPNVFEFDADHLRCFLNVVVSSGRVAFTKALLDTQKPSFPNVTKLSLHGRSNHNKNWDVGQILQCFKLLPESCVSMSEFEAFDYESPAFGPNCALAILKNLPVERTCIQTLTLHRFSVNDDVLEFCCHQFPSLTCLDVGNNEILQNVPAAIHLLSHLVTLNLHNCSNLTSLPDEMLKLRPTLVNILGHGCSAITFPPKDIFLKGKNHIFQFLQDAEKAKPLRRVKVVFLGNGRSGKTSLLRALAKKPLRPGDVGPDSTKGVTVNALDKELQPGFLEKCFERLPDIKYWDFAGQLEYSAAHDFFLSNRQAVYVIIFSVTDDRDSQMDQVVCVTSLMYVHCFFALNNDVNQVLAAYRIFAGVAACALLYCGDQSRRDSWLLGRCEEETGCYRKRHAQCGHELPRPVGFGYDQFFICYCYGHTPALLSHEKGAKTAYEAFMPVYIRRRSSITQSTPLSRPIQTFSRCCFKTPATAIRPSNCGAEVCQWQGIRLTGRITHQRAEPAGTPSVA
jgi:hypothetical protein